MRKIKLRRAADLIQSGEVQISDVAYMTGFSSAAYFRRIFKKEYGVTPTEYAQKLPSSTNN
ncbi:MAG: helix-turn-helix domain-containing protein [Muribaculaceae bacterium]|nr:helix-turn-helix domain-containing protein [Muribaculaceae bacterium]